MTAPITIFSLSQAGVLHLSGADRADFLQRQTTNNVANIGQGEMRGTVLTSATARILDILLIIAEADHLLALTLPGQGAQTAAYLKGRIFFMDKVVLEDHSHNFAQWTVFGEDISRILDENDLSPQCMLWQLPYALQPTFRLLAPLGMQSAVEQVLKMQGAQWLDAVAYQKQRIEQGLPDAGHELSANFTPLEAGLQNIISQTKGCYTGQEIIARQITYDKITRHLVGLHAEKPLPPGASLQAEGRLAGVITSAAVSPRFGHIGLGMVKRPHHQPGSTLIVQDAAVQVCSLPFE